MLLLSICGVLIVNMPADAATLATERARVREMLYETDSTNSVYSDALINEAINEGQNLLSNLLSYSANYDNIGVYGYVRTTASVSLTASLIGTRFKKVIGVWGRLDATTAGTPWKSFIQIKPEEDFRAYSITNKDPMWYYSDGAFAFYPANVSGQTDLIYVKYLKGYTNTDTDSVTLDIQPRYERMLTLAAAMLILTWDNQATRAAALKQSLTDLITIENQQMLNSNVIEKASGGVK